MLFVSTAPQRRSERSFRHQLVQLLSSQLQRRLVQNIIKQCFVLEIAALDGCALNDAVNRFYYAHNSHYLNP